MLPGDNMQRLKIVRLKIGDVFSESEKRQYSEAGKVHRIEEKFSHLPHPLIISLTADEVILEYPE